jgi:hypothetical protein
MAKSSANEGQQLETTIEKERKGNRKCTITDDNQIIRKSSLYNHHRIKKIIKVTKPTRFHTPKFVIHIFQATKQSME